MPNYLEGQCVAVGTDAYILHPTRSHHRAVHVGQFDDPEYAQFFAFHLNQQFSEDVCSEITAVELASFRNQKHAA